MDADTLSIASSIASLVLAVIAIWQAVYFYTQAKNTETRVETALAAIQGQVQTLQAINGKTLDRLTKYVTTPRDDANAHLVKVLSATIEQTSTIFERLQLPQATIGTPTGDSLSRDAILRNIALWYYSAATNVWASFSLPPVNEFSSENPNHIIVKNIIDNSFHDFNSMSKIIGQLTDAQIDASGIRNFYDEVKGTYSGLVADTGTLFARQT